MKKLPLLLFAFALIMVSCKKEKNNTELPLGEDPATYQLTITSNWTATSHPTDFPSTAHFSTPIGFVHNTSGAIYATGQLASIGVQRMAELGSNKQLNEEIQAQISAGKGRLILQGSSNLGNTASQTIEFTTDKDSPLVSIVSMIAPSPDWFIGRSGVSLVDENGAWLPLIEVDLRSYDSGTDSGVSFTSPNQVTNPAVPIFLIQEPPLAIALGEDVNPALAKMSLKRIR